MHRTNGWSIRDRALHLASLAAAVAIMAAFATSASAQHAKFVLFGEPDAAAADVPAAEKFVHPVSSPYYHEDSFVTTDIRIWAIYHDFPKSSVIGGGNAKVFAVQVRLALTDQLQFVAYKDGYTDWDAGIIDDSGWNDIAAGLKWNFWQDWENQFHAAVGVGYEIAAGDKETLHDDDEWRVWGSVNKGFDKLHLGATVNAFFADDKGDGLGNSDRLSWHLHGDYYVCEWFSPVVEVNGYHVLDEGTVTVPFQGLDVVNLGGGDDPVVTGAIGFEIRPCESAQFRLAYEAPIVNQDDDLFGYRWTFSMIFSF